MNAAQSAPEATKKVKSIDPSVLQAASPGDIPDALRKRYFSTTSKWSGEPAYFTSAQAKETAFRDQGRRLITSSESAEVVRDLVAIADRKSVVWGKSVSVRVDRVGDRRIKKKKT